MLLYSLNKMCISIDSVGITVYSFNLQFNGVMELVFSHYTKKVL